MQEWLLLLELSASAVMKADTMNAHLNLNVIVRRKVIEWYKGNLMVCFSWAGEHTKIVSSFAPYPPSIWQSYTLSHASSTKSKKSPGMDEMTKIFA